MKLFLALILAASPCLAEDNVVFSTTSEVGSVWVFKNGEVKKSHDMSWHTTCEILAEEMARSEATQTIEDMAPQIDNSPMQSIEQRLIEERYQHRQ